MTFRIIAIAFLMLFSPALFADEPSKRLEEVSILGDPDRVSSIAGSAHQLDQDFLARFAQGDIMRVLRSVPGVYLQEEDGSGLRPNIGIRGSGLDRSSRIALLEDGVLIAPAPYAAPAAYYFPTQRRMSTVEVLKGPSAVRLGPRTTGGAMNLISTPLPQQREATAAWIVGEDGFSDTHAWYADRTDTTAWLVETVQQRSDGFKQLDNGGPTGFDTRDYLGKFRINSRADASIQQSLEFKSGYTAHVSDETYLGLTDDDFANDPYRRYAASQLDQLRSTHRQYQATYAFGPAAGLWRSEITAYRNEFARNWFKLDAVTGTGISTILDNPDLYVNELSWLRGEQDSRDDALTLRNNKREYLSRGVQASISAKLGENVAHDLRAGLRLHEDKEDRFQHDDLFAMRDGLMVQTSTGGPGSQSNRVSSADVTALFIEDRISVGQFELTPGLRFERIELSRVDFSTADPGRGSLPTRDSGSRTDVLIPAFGASYNPGNAWTWLAGVSRGFNPPAPGSQAKEEDSVNYELGTRFNGAALNAEAIGFYNDYSNLVGTCTASTGGDCIIGDQFDGGIATVAGVEMLVDYELSPSQTPTIVVPLRLTYTWTGRAEFDNSFQSGFSPWGNVVAGDELPYVPQHQFQLAADVVGPRWSAGLNLDFVGDTRTEAGQGDIVAEKGIESHWVVDVAGRYYVNDHLELFGRIDNLLDETYAAARRPAGLRPGKPRTALVGLKVKL